MNETLEKALAALTAAKDQAVASYGPAKAKLLDYLRTTFPKGNLIGDIARNNNPKALFNKDDARNALVGSALGGLVLGGAGLMSDRDPDESKFAPVGDALLGAILGGAAGYGIPKGLRLFTNPTEVSKPDAPKGPDGFQRHVGNPVGTYFGSNGSILPLGKYFGANGSVYPVGKYVGEHGELASLPTNGALAYWGSLGLAGSRAVDFLRAVSRAKTTLAQSKERFDTEATSRSAAVSAHQKLLADATLRHQLVDGKGYQQALNEVGAAINNARRSNNSVLANNLEELRGRIRATNGGSGTVAGDTAYQALVSDLRGKITSAQQDLAATQRDYIPYSKPEEFSATVSGIKQQIKGVKSQKSNDAIDAIRRDIAAVKQNKTNVTIDNIRRRIEGVLGNKTNPTIDALRTHIADIESEMRAMPREDRFLQEGFLKERKSRLESAVADKKTQDTAQVKTLKAQLKHAIGRKKIHDKRRLGDLGRDLKSEISAKKTLDNQAIDRLEGVLSDVKTGRRDALRGYRSLLTRNGWGDVIRQVGQEDTPANSFAKRHIFGKPGRYREIPGVRGPLNRGVRNVGRGAAKGAVAGIIADIVLGMIAQRQAQAQGQGD